MLIGPKNEKTKNFTSYETINDSITGDSVASFELERDIAVEQNTNFRTYSFKIKCPIIYKSLFIDLINNCKKILSDKEKAINFLHQLDRLEEFVKNESHDFFLFSFSQDISYRLEIKVVGVNSLCIVFARYRGPGLSNAYSCHLQNKNKAKAINYELVYNFLQADTLIIYWIFNQLLALYLAQDRLNFIISKSIMYGLRFKKPELSFIEIMSRGIPEKEIIKSKDIWHKILLIVMNKCFPNPSERCPNLEHFKGSLIKLKLRLDKDLIELTAYIDNHLLSSGTETSNNLITFGIRREEGYVDMGIRIYGPAIKQDFYLKDKNFSHIIHDFAEVLKILGVIRHVKEIYLLKKFCNSYYLF